MSLLDVLYRQQSPVSQTESHYIVCVKLLVDKAPSARSSSLLKCTTQLISSLQSVPTHAQPGTHAARQVALRNIAIDNNRDIFA